MIGLLRQHMLPKRVIRQSLGQRYVVIAKFVSRVEDTAKDASCTQMAQFSPVLSMVLIDHGLPLTDLLAARVRSQHALTDARLGQESCCARW